MDSRKPSHPKFDRDQIKNRVPEKRSHEVDQKYVEEHPGYKPGVWMANPSSLSAIEKEREREEGDDKILKEEIDRYINDYSRENKTSTRDAKDKIDNDIKNREKLLEDLKRRDAEGYLDRESPRRTDVEEEKRKIENMYQKMLEEDLEKQRQLQKERKKMNELIKRRIEEQDRLLVLERKEIEERNKRMLADEQLKNEIERNKLRELKKQREELLKQELNELSQIEKHEKKKKMIEEELKRSIKERELEKERFEDINRKIEELRQREMEELSRIKNKEDEIARRRRELLDDAYPNNKLQDDDVIEVWPCGSNDPNMCIVDPRDLCVDPFSGKLVIRGDSLPRPLPNQNERKPKPKRSNASIGKANKKKMLTKQKYLELLSSYDPKKLKRKLSFQNWLINDSGQDENTVAQRFPGSDFSLKIDMNDWPAIKEESQKRYAALRKS
ncbi:hypothetical protein WDU94_014789 [Cyamophila willieti]